MKRLSSAYASYRKRVEVLHGEFDLYIEEEGACAADYLLAGRRLVSRYEDLVEARRQISAYSLLERPIEVMMDDMALYANAIGGWTQ